MEVVGPPDTSQAEERIRAPALVRLGRDALGFPQLPQNSDGLDRVTARPFHILDVGVRRTVSAGPLGALLHRRSAVHLPVAVDRLRRPIDDVLDRLPSLVRTDVPGDSRPCRTAAAAPRQGEDRGHHTDDEHRTVSFPPWTHGQQPVPRSTSEAVCPVGSSPVIVSPCPVVASSTSHSDRRPPVKPTSAIGRPHP